MDVGQELNDWSSGIIGSAMGVHSNVGPGLLEGAYERCLLHELLSRGFAVEHQLVLPLRYKGVLLDAAYRIDLLINSQIVVEVKATRAISPIHEAQVLSYLKLGNYPLGFILNFHVEHMKDGIKRLVNGSNNLRAPSRPSR